MSVLCGQTCTAGFGRCGDVPFFRNLIGVSSSRLSASMLCSTFNSIGNPWQSHPGTYLTFLPSIPWYRLMKSFKILFNAWLRVLGNAGIGKSKGNRVNSRG